MTTATEERKVSRPTMVSFVATKAHYRAHLDPVVEAIGKASPELRQPGGIAVIVAASQADLWTAKRLAAKYDGVPRIALLEHGIGQSYDVAHGAYPGGVGRDAVGLFLSPNDTAAARDRAAYPDARVVVVGDPRLDTLPDRIPDGKATVALSFHADDRLCPETRSALRHYRAGLTGLRDRFNLIGHCHPRARHEVLPIFRHYGIEYVADFDEVCRRTDVYVCDNSSTIYEFASTGRPVVLMNAPNYRRDVEHGLRFWAAAGVGRQVDDPGIGLVMAIEEALTEDRWRDRREAALDIAYRYRSGAAQRAADAIAEFVSEG